MNRQGNLSLKVSGYASWMVAGGAALYVVLFALIAPYSLGCGALYVCQTSESPCGTVIFKAAATSRRSIGFGDLPVLFMIRVTFKQQLPGTSSQALSRTGKVFRVRLGVGWSCLMV